MASGKETNPVSVPALPGAVFCGNRSREGRGEELTVRDPSTGEVIAELASGAASDVDEVVLSAAAAVNDDWARWTPAERGRLCLRIAAALRRESDALTELVVHDAGLPVSMARSDVETAARYFEYYGGLADKRQGDTIPLGPDYLDYTRREPWGVCAIVLPFNVPTQMAARSLAPALIGGNTVVIKPAEQAPFAPLALLAICAEAGAPSGVVNAVVGGGTTGASLVGHDRVDHITFTGSLATGRRIMATAAETMTPLVLELGGKSPQIVFADGDLERAAVAIVGSALRTAGQVCSAGTRVLVERPVYDELAGRLVALASSLQVGSAESDPDVGPVISADQRERILRAVDAGVEQGATLLAGGRATVMDGAGGYFVAPTLLQADPDSSVMREEVFGPVLALMPFSGEGEAVRLVNDSDYGLVAGVWTKDLGRAHRVAHSVKAGQVFVNCYGVGGGVELPFGGYKRSGFGRLKGIAGADEYTQLKNVCVALT
jgi:acyl-CoA reductase-like NAD-dependent aldehyde dehydrogenase